MNKKETLEEKKLRQEEFLKNNPNYKKGVSIWEFLIGVTLVISAGLLIFTWATSKGDSATTNYTINKSLQELQASLLEYKQTNLVQSKTYQGLTVATLAPYLDSKIFRVNGANIELIDVPDVKIQVIAGQSATSVNNAVSKVLFNASALATVKGYDTNQLTKLENTISSFFKETSNNACIIDVDAIAIGGANVSATADTVVGTADGIVLIDRATF